MTPVWITGIVVGMPDDGDKPEQDSGRPSSGPTCGAPCHPDRRVHAKGLCQPCYRAQLKSKKKPSACHPEEPEYAKGFCAPCYWHEHKAAGKVEPFVPGLPRDQLPLLRNGPCGICRRSGVKLELDRDKRTGRLRGLLCDRCTALVENETLVQFAADYLKPWIRSQSA